MGGVSQSLLGLGVDVVRSGEDPKGRLLRPKMPGLARCRGEVFGEGQSAC